MRHEDSDGMLRLNIGAGATYLPGFCNIDLAPYADLSLDLNTDRLPFEDGSVDPVFATESNLITSSRSHVAETEQIVSFK